MLVKTPLLHQSFGPRVCLSFFLFLSFSLSLYFWLIPWRAKAGCVTQGILASFLLSLSHRGLWTTRFLSIKGPTSGAWTGTLVHAARLGGSDPQGLLRPEVSLKILCCSGRSQDDGGIGRGDHFIFYKFIERTTERWTKFTKQLLIASSGHQAPRKAAHCLQREVGQGYWRLKRETKERGTETPPGKRVLLEEVSNHQETLALAGPGEVFKSQRAA